MTRLAVVLLVVALLAGFGAGYLTKDQTHHHKKAQTTTTDYVETGDWDWWK